MSKTTILISEDQIKNVTPLGGDVDMAKLLPAIKTAQETNIRKLLGIPLYKKLQEDYENDSLFGVYEELLFDYIQPMIIHLSTAYYLTYGAYQFTNKGAYKANSETSVGLSRDEIDYVVKSQEKLYKSYKNDFYSWIKSNHIGEYEENKVVKNTKRIGGWIFTSSKPKPSSFSNNQDDCYGCKGIIEW